VTVAAASLVFRNAETGQTWSVTGADLASGCPANVAQVFAHDGGLELSGRQRKVQRDPRFPAFVATAPPAPPAPPPGFARGTLLDTPRGPVPVERLGVGDLVVTRDSGPRPVRAILRGDTGLAPSPAVRFDAGAIGNDRPLTVSPGLRLLLGGYRAELLFGEAEVLAEAADLVNDLTVTRVFLPPTECLELVLDRHEIVQSNGAPAECLAAAAPGSAASLLTRELAAVPERRVLSAEEARALVG
jgi:hypothetical protein